MNTGYISYIHRSDNENTNKSNKYDTMRGKSEMYLKITMDTNVLYYIRNHYTFFLHLNANVSI